MNAVSTVTAPTEEPVTLADAKLHMRVDITDDDDLISSFITSARQHLEFMSSRSFITQTLDLKMDSFPTGDIEIPNSPLQSITSIKYIDTDGNQQTWASSSYDVDSDSVPARVSRAYGEDYPSIRSQNNAVEVRFIAGYGSASTVPQAIRQAIKLLVAHWYENRETVLVGTISGSIEFTVRALMSNYKVYTY